MRVALGLEYDGTGYNGWQRQKCGVGVQEVVEHALAAVAAHPVECVAAGRTDAGVHALAQVAHFDTTARRSPRNWLLGVNSNLPADVSVSWAVPVDREFHARYSATARTYRYLVLNRATRSALWRHRAWWVHRALDEERMREAAVPLHGEHDFSAFRAAGCQARTAVREMQEIAIERSGDWLAITVRANAFLQHMVRNIVGVLVAIGQGERPPAWAGEVLASRDRRQGGVAAPPHGLTLVAVAYPADCGLPRPPLRPTPP